MRAPAPLQDVSIDILHYKDTSKYYRMLLQKSYTTWTPSLLGDVAAEILDFDMDSQKPLQDAAAEVLYYQDIDTTKGY